MLNLMALDEATVVLYRDWTQNDLNNLIKEKEYAKRFFPKDAESTQAAINLIDYKIERARVFIEHLKSLDV